MRAERQYLERHAEPEASLANLIERRFGHVVTIPAYGEGAELAKAVASVPEGLLGDVLVIVVVNGRTDAPAPMQAANRVTLEHLCEGADRIASGASLSESPGRVLLAIDRASSGRELPPRHGVGLARKIAADLALALWARGSIASPWIHCTDADVVLPSDYFAQAARIDQAAAIVYPFRHQETGDPARDRDALEYEISLRYYVGGLRHAGSPHAHHTIGSTLAVRASAYAQVRGFPKRLAAEDFYLLNKVAKVGDVRSLDGAPIALSARSSARTPFGTGRALERARRQGQESLRCYHPEIFSYLGAWEQLLRQLVGQEGVLELGELFSAQLAHWSGVDGGLLRESLSATGAWRSAAAASSRPPGRVRANYLRQGFDASRTLKLVHSLRDNALASPPLPEALAAARFLVWDRSESLEAARARLDAQERLSARGSPLSDD